MTILDHYNIYEIGFHNITYTYLILSRVIREIKIYVILISRVIHSIIFIRLINLLKSSLSHKREKKINSIKNS